MLGILREFLHEHKCGTPSDLKCVLEEVAKFHSRAAERLNSKEIPTQADHDIGVRTSMLQMPVRIKKTCRSVPSDHSLRVQDFEKGITRYPPSDFTNVFAVPLVAG